MTSKMKPEIKARFLAALRDPATKQITAQMRNSAGCMCAEGVLMDLYAQDHGLGWSQTNDTCFNVVEAGDASCGWLENSSIVWPWAFEDYNGEKPRINGDSLMSLNDSLELSFLQIADLVEENW